MKYGIVTGSPRSGTTFLMSVLNTLPRVECITGTVLPVAIPHVVNQDVSNDVYEALTTGFERALDAYLHSGRVHSRAAALQKWFRAPSGISDLYGALKGERSIERLIYKEPFLSMAPEFTMDALPDAKIIYIYRDGRDVANSLVNTYDVLTDEKLTDLKSSEMRVGREYDHRYVPWWVENGREKKFIDSSPYVRAIWMWKFMVRKCHDAFTRPSVENSSRIMFLRYEDFVQDPVKHGERMLQHLGKPSNAALKRQLSRAHTSSIGKYTERDSGEIAAAERIAEDELRLLEYELTTMSEKQRDRAFT